MTKTRRRAVYCLRQTGRLAWGICAMLLIPSVVVGRWDAFWAATGMFGFPGLTAFLVADLMDPTSHDYFFEESPEDVE